MYQLSREGHCERLTDYVGLKEAQEYTTNSFHDVSPWECPINHDIGQADFLGQRHLGSYSSDRFSAGEAVSFSEASDLGLAISRHDDGFLHTCVDTSLEQQRHVVNDHRMRVFSCSLFRQSGLLAGDAGMDDVFELPTFFQIVEDDVSESLSVERTVLIEHCFSEERDDLSPSRFARLDDFTGQFVGIDDDRAALLKHLGDGALAGSDAPCESDQNHGGGA